MTTSNEIPTDKPVMSFPCTFDEWERNVGTHRKDALDNAIEGVFKTIKKSDFRYVSDGCGGVEHECWDEYIYHDVVFLCGTYKETVSVKYWY